MCACLWKTEKNVRFPRTRAADGCRCHMCEGPESSTQQQRFLSTKSSRQPLVVKLWPKTNCKWDPPNTWKTSGSLHNPKPGRTSGHANGGEG